MNDLVKKQCDLISELGDSNFLSSDKEIYSYKSFANSVNEKIVKLKGIGCNQGDGVALGTSHGLDYFISFIAILAIDCVVIPIDKSANQDAINFIFEKTKPKVILGVENKSFDYIPNLHESKVYPSQLGAILFTSGSSGTPKGVMLTSAALLGNALATLRPLDFNKNDHLFVNTPYHFTSAICHFLSAFFSTGKLTIIETKLLPLDLISAISDSGANAFGGAPIQLLWIVGAINSSLNLRWVMTSGDDLPESTQKQLATKYPKSHLFVFYGLTECGGRFCARSPTNNSAKYRSVGKPIPGMKVEIVDTASNSLAAGNIGEVVVYGKFLMSGYLGEDKPIFTSNGGLKTGDSGYIDESGNLYLLGRLDDVFKVAGQKVSGLRIRDAILQTKMVCDAFIIPFRDANSGVIPGLIYVEDSKITFEKSLFIRKLRSLLPTNHIPRKLIVVSNIERTGSGKIIKKNLINNLAKLNIARLEDGSFTEESVSN